MTNQTTDLEHDMIGYRYNPEPPDYDEPPRRRKQREEPDDYMDDADAPADDYRYDPMRNAP